MKNNERKESGRMISVRLDANGNARLRQLKEYYKLSDSEAIRLAIDEKWKAIVVQKAEALLHKGTSDEAQGE